MTPDQQLHFLLNSNVEDNELLCFKIKELIEKGADVNSIHNSKPLISAAVIKGYYNALRVIVQAGADINIQYSEFPPPLHSAIAYNRGLIFNFLVDAGADLNIKNLSGNTPLISTAIFNNFEMAKYLIINGADIDATNSNGETALIMAAKNQCNDIVMALIERGANLNIKSLYKENALQHIMLYKNNDDIMEEMLKRGSDFDFNTLCFYPFIVMPYIHEKLKKEDIWQSTFYYILKEKDNCKTLDTGLKLFLLQVENDIPENIAIILRTFL